MVAGHYYYLERLGGIMCKVYVVLVLVRGPLTLHIKEPRDLSFPDYMNQASDMAKPYLPQGWHMQSAREECVCATKNQ